jgi:hypothetical protein
VVTRSMALDHADLQVAVVPARAGTTAIYARLRQAGGAAEAALFYDLVQHLKRHLIRVEDSGAEVTDVVGSSQPDRGIVAQLRHLALPIG